MLRIRLSLCIAALAAAVILPRAALAGGTESFNIDESDAFNKGELDGTAALSNGSVMVSVGKERVALEGVTVAWSYARSGNTVYVGTGSNGRILKVEGTKVTTFAETKQLLVSAMAMGPNGTLYAGTLPEGRIYQVDSAGKVKELAKPEGAKHIWGMLWDAKLDALVVGTGPEGKVFSVDAAGKTAVLYDDEATHIMSLARDKNGDLYFGTSNEARVYRRTADGHVDMVYDFPGNEITSVAVLNGDVVVAANSFDDARGSGDKKADAPPAPKSGSGEVWRRAPNGQAERVYFNTADYVTRVAWQKDGSVLAGTGKEGRVVRIAPNRSFATWVDADERQILGMDWSGEAPFILTGDAAALYWIKPAPAPKATWTSATLDGGGETRFGELTWRATGAVEFQTRSGNTEKPNDTWSAWSTPITAPGPVRSQSARFLQIRATWKSNDAVLLAVTAYYIKANQRARVSAVTVDAEEKKEGTKKASPVLKLKWKVDNVDGDSLRYYVRFRGETQTKVRDMLAPTTVLTTTNYDWNTESIPDGVYVVSVEATDELSNPPALALSDTAESEPLLVDNHAPSIEGLHAEGNKVVGRAVDNLGPISKIEYAVDGGRWRVAFPVDDLFDTRTEAFAITVDGANKDHIVAVRVSDAAGNTTVDEITTRAP